MRTQEDIVERLKEIRAGKYEDFLGFQQDLLFLYVPRRLAAPFFKKDITEEEKKAWMCREFTEESVTADMVDYFDFAISKCVGHRGISASRSIEKLSTWAWILGRDDLVAFANEDSNYPQYGAPILKKFCEEFGVDVPMTDAFQRMARGEHCGADYPCGCGK